MRLVLAILLAWQCVGQTVVPKTIQESGGDYPTIALWEAGENANLVAADEIRIGVIQGGWTTTNTAPVVISGWTTDATRYLVLTNSTSRHYGQFDYPGAHILEVTDAVGIFINAQYVRLYGLQVRVTAAAAANRHPVWASVSSGGSEIVVQDCIVRNHADAFNSHYVAQFLDTDLGTVHFVNNVCWSQQISSPATPAVGLAAANHYVWNNTIYSTASGITRTAGTGSYYNNIVVATGGSDYTGISSGGDYNFSSDTTYTGGAHDKRSITPAFDNPSIGLFTFSDFRVVGRGTANPGSGYYATDITGATRAGWWDPGAFEFANGPARTAPIINVRQ